MITLLRKPLMPLPSKGRPVLWLVVSLTFAVSLVFTGVLFAASAQAQGTNAPESTTEAPIAEAAPESAVPSEPTTPPANEQVSSTGEQAPPATEQTPPASEEADVAVEQPQPSDEHEQSLSATEESASPDESTPPVVGDPPSTSEPTPPTVENPPSTSEPTPPTVENPPSTSEPTPPVAEQAPPTGVKAPPTAEEAPPAHEQETIEQTSKAGGEASSEGRSTEGPGNSQTSANVSGSDRKELVGEVAPAASPAATVPDTTTAMPVVSMVPGESQAPVTLEPSTSSARRQARQVSRELAAFGASTIGTGSVGRWLDTPDASSASTIAFADLEASSAAAIARVVPAGDESGGSAVANHTSAPGNGSAPGGAGGGSATGAGSGAASSASSMFVDTLLQSVPNVMRRLCESQSSWHTSFFALIPERPG
jgi:hypothetical protein